MTMPVRYALFSYYFCYFLYSLFPRCSFSSSRSLHTPTLPFPHTPSLDGITPSVLLVPIPPAPAPTNDFFSPFIVFSTSQQNPIFHSGLWLGNVKLTLCLCLRFRTFPGLPLLFSNFGLSNFEYRTGYGDTDRDTSRSLRVAHAHADAVTAASP